MSTPTTDPPSPSSPQRSRRRRGRIFFWLLFGICLAAVIGSLVTLKTSSGIYDQTGRGMENTIMPGDRVFVVPTGQVHRGDIIVEENQQGESSELSSAGLSACPVIMSSAATPRPTRPRLFVTSVASSLPAAAGPTWDKASRQRPTCDRPPS